MCIYIGHLYTGIGQRTKRKIVFIIWLTRCVEDEIEKIIWMKNMCCPCDRPRIMRQFSVLYISLTGFFLENRFFHSSIYRYMLDAQNGFYERTMRAQKFSIFSLSFDKRIMMQQKYDFKWKWWENSRLTGDI